MCHIKIKTLNKQIKLISVLSTVPVCTVEVLTTTKFILVFPPYPRLLLYLLLFSLSSIRFKNVMFDISPTEEVGDFEVKAKFMGVEMEKVQLHFQVNI